MLAHCYIFARSALSFWRSRRWPRSVPGSYSPRLPSRVSFFYDDCFGLGGVFDRPWCIKSAFPHGQIVTFGNRPEIIEDDLVDIKVAFHSDMRFGKKVSIACQFHFSAIENNCLCLDR